MYSWKAHTWHLSNRPITGAWLISLSLSLLALAAYITLYLGKIDLHVILYLEPHKRGLIRYIFSFISSLGRGEMLLFMLVLLLLMPLKIPKRKEIFWKGSLSIALAGALSLVMKLTIGRPRPSLLLSGYYWPHGPTLCDKFHSTPSGHTTAVFALACLISHYFPRQRYIFLLIALMVGISRVFLIYHYPSDIILSIFLGCIAGKWASVMNLPRFMGRNDIEK